MKAYYGSKSLTIKLAIITSIIQLQIGQIVLISDSNTSTADDGVDGNIAWSISGDTLTLSVQPGQAGTNMSDYDQTDPSTSGRPLWEFGAGWVNVSKIVIENGITTIGDNAFLHTNISIFSIPTSVSTLGFQSFARSKVSTVIYDGSNGSIGIAAFSMCTSLKIVILGDTVRTIGDSAFKDCVNLEKFTFGTGTVNISSTAFEHGVSFDGGGGTYAGHTYIRIMPTIVLYMVVDSGLEGDYAEWYITQQWHTLKIEPVAPLATAELPNRTTSTRPTWESGAQWQDIITQGELHIVLSGITNIGQYDFYNCDMLLSAVYDSNLTAFGTQAFADCGQIDYIDISSYNPTSGNIYLASGITSIGQNQFSAAQFTALTIDQTDATFGTRCFWGSGVQQQSIKSNVLGDQMFYQCSQLQQIDLSDSNQTSIPNQFAEGCPLLQSVILPDSVETLSNHCFAGTQIASITLPDTVTSIDGAFRNCQSLTSITIPESVTSMRGQLFYECTSLQSITFVNGCPNITEWGNSMFIRCSSLTSVILPSNITTTGNNAFFQCTSLSYVKLPTALETIGVKAFGECTSLTQLDIPTGVTTIEQNAFLQSAVHSIILPTTVTTIGLTQFSQVSPLTLYAKPTTPPTIDITQIDTTDLTIYVPSQSLSAYKTQWATWEPYIVQAPEATISLSQSTIDISVYGGQTVTASVDIDTFWYGGHVYWESQDYSLVGITYSGFNADLIAYGTVSSVVVTAMVDEWFYDRTQSARLDVNVIYNSESNVEVIEGYIYDYTITPSVTPQTLTLYGNATSWVSVQNDYQLYGIVPADITAQNDLVVVQRTSQPDQTYSWHITFTQLPSQTVIIGDDATAEVYPTGRTIILGSGQTYADTLAPYANLITTVDIRGLTTITDGTLPVLANEITLILGDSVHTFTDSNHNVIAGLVIGKGLTEIPQGLRLYNQETELISDATDARGHIFIKSTTNDTVLYQADSVTSRNSYNNATCYAVVGESLVNSPADLIEFRFSMLMEVTEQIQNFISLSTQSWEVTVPTGAGFKDVAIIDGILTGTAPNTKGTYQASCTHNISNNQYRNADYLCSLSPLALDFTIYVEKKLIIG